MYRSVQRQLIYWTAFVVLTLGGIVALVCLQPPTPSNELFVSRAYSRAHPQAKNRLPASPKSAGLNTPPLVGVAAHAATDAQNFSAEITLDCKTPQPPQLSYSFHQTRLKGTLCNPKTSTKAELLSSEIRNTTNGTTATAFYPTALSFMTDYLTLLPGENHILITHHLKDGSKEEKEYVLELAQRLPNEPNHR